MVVLVDEVVLVVEGVVVGLVKRKPGIGRGVGNLVSIRSVSSPRRPLISWLAYSGTEWVRWLTW